MELMVVAKVEMTVISMPLAPTLRVDTLAHATKDMIWHRMVRLAGIGNNTIYQMTDTLKMKTSRENGKQ